MTKIKRETLDELVKMLARKYTAPLLDASLRDMARDVKDVTGYYEPSTSVLAAALRRVGLTPRGRRWAWRHNPGKGE